ncbi:hydroxypyruvate isomerase family protein [Parasediminibacterium paludis]|uniref:Hydroxypyruvate isomerase family protein n=1 Tax=Parasediminibacterium paludis TaxID=908966 RepID=A0ABV8Q0F8_9BACT
MSTTNRRTVIKNILAGSVAASTTGILSSFSSPQAQTSALKRNINHSVCRWTYDFLTLDELCQVVNSIGFSAIDLCGPKDWPILKQYNIFSSMCNGAEISLVKGWNDTQYHATLIKNYTEMIPLVAAAGYKNLICFSGNRNGMADDLGMKNAADGLKQIMSTAEKYGVTIQMELLNSKVNHKDYMCDRSQWGVDLCKMIGSENFKLLYDIYHMQIDEGDVISTINAHHQYFGHYHTGGVPGRHEINDTQELYYPAIMKAILATGYKGYVAQEFIPTGNDKVASLKQAINICDI